VLFKHFYVIVWQVGASLLVTVGRPVELGKVNVECTELFRYCLDDSDTCVDNFWSDTVRTNLSDPVGRLPLRCEISEISPRRLRRLTSSSITSWKAVSLLVQVTSCDGCHCSEVD
jgi:hypothetical protein